MTDPSITAIDRVFDLVDGAVDKVDRVLNRARYTEEQHRARRAKRPVVIDTAASVRVVSTKAAPPSPAESSAIASRRFRVVEKVDSSSGSTIFVVTNGGDDRVECSTRELAQKILRALETSA